MKKQILAGFIVWAISALIFATPSYSFFQSENIDLNNTTPTKESVDSKIENSTKPQGSGNGDKLYYDLGYLTSTDHYLKKEEKGNLSKEEKLKLANSYRMNSMTEDAEFWYGEFVTEESDPKYILHYAEMLQSNGKCEAAVKWFQIYAANTEDANRDFLKDCDVMEGIPENQNVKITNLEALNTSSLDFSPILYQDGIVISSTRGAGQRVRRKDTWTKEKFSDLFFAEKDEDSFKKPVEFDGFNESFHDGTITFNQQGNYAIFTRNSNKGKSSKGVRELKLFESKKEGDKWGKAKSLNINNNNFATCHPTLSPDGRWLYFSSNRPGGFGEMDIYVSQKVGNKWSDPKNLGPTVNSSGNEIFPVMHDDGKLYYSSNGHVGVGGLDIFVAEKTDVMDEDTWEIRRNIGTPFNSPKDDMGFLIDKENQSGYFASNRKGGKGKDDIYHWTMGEITAANTTNSVGSGHTNVICNTCPTHSKKTEKKPSGRSFCVYDITTNKRLEGVNVSILPKDLSNSSNELALTLKPMDNTSDEFVLGVKKQENSPNGNSIAVSNKEGKFQYEMLKDEDYYFVLSKKGYSTVQHLTDLTKVMNRNEYCIAMAPRSCVTLKGDVQNETYNQPVPFAEVSLFNRCTGEILKTRADEKGGFEFCVDCDCEYNLTVQKDHFNASEMVINTLNGNCKSGSLEDVLINLVMLEGANQNNLNPVQQHPFNNEYTQTSSYANNPNKSAPSEEFLTEYFTGNSSNLIETGQTLTLRNVYYDFDKYEIKAQAGVELDYIASLMKLKPTMEIELISHTDTRGEDNYNKELSEKRAQSAQAYLISKGVDAKRIKQIKGMGEMHPISPCQNDNCSEEQHSINRRTEVTILKM